MSEDMAEQEADFYDQGTQVLERDSEEPTFTMWQKAIAWSIVVFSVIAGGASAMFLLYGTLYPDITLQNALLIPFGVAAMFIAVAVYLMIGFAFADSVTNWIDKLVR